MTADIHPVQPADDGEWLQTRPGERCRIRVAGAETNGAWSVVETLSNPGDSTPMHVHQHEDEHFLVLEGMARIARGHELPHAWGNASGSTLRMLVTCWPGGCEETMRVIARGGDIDIAG